VSLRAHGFLHEARREFIAARDLPECGARPDERPIIRFELALTALALDDGPASRDLFQTVESQVRELWHLRLQRLAMLRQARQREEVEAARARAEREILRDPLTGLGNRRRFDVLIERVSRHGEEPLTLAGWATRRCATPATNSWSSCAGTPPRGPRSASASGRRSPGRPSSPTYA
jgi:hypothetical protein